MYISNLGKVFAAAVGLLPLFVSAAPSIPLSKRQPAPAGPGNQFLGSLTWYPQQPELILATVSNNSTTHYALLSKNNLFDDLHPYRPLQAATTSGTPITLVGTRHPYPSIDDTQFKDFPPGTAWERYFNMSAYLPPFTDASGPESRCLSFQLPKIIDALAIDDTKPDLHLADIFLTQGLTQVELISTPVHYNVTVLPGTGTPTSDAPEAAQTGPTISQAPGIFLPSSVQTGQPVNVLQGLTPTAPEFFINSKTYSNVKALPE
ncbi:MAG: hypothetical protein LQ337_007355 [Flavoplaca oasis]|nr:MAG: hypothetical protein LQ337_007355 [Flavoplaca oasis]